jgi:hypothetical protein
LVYADVRYSSVGVLTIRRLDAESAIITGNARRVRLRGIEYWSVPVR